VARANQLFSLDEAIRDSPAVVGAFIVHDDEPAAPQARHRDPTRADPRRDHRSDRELTEGGPVVGGVTKLRNAVVRIIAKLVDELRGDRTHAFHPTRRV
jgi:hypothetical protein